MFGSYHACVKSCCKHACISNCSEGLDLCSCPRNAELRKIDIIKTVYLTAFQLTLIKCTDSSVAFAARRYDKHQTLKRCSKTCLKRPLEKKTKNWFSRPIIT